MARLVVWFGVMLAACGSSADKPATVAAADEQSTDRAVVVELFTSQGCNSCPPADAWLTELGRPGAVDGVEVITLAYHVDYWNDLGWEDPFSSAEWSRRQRTYSKAIAGGRVYTPQMVIDGREHVVGSKRASVTRAVQRAANRAVLPAEVNLSVDAADTIHVDVGVTLGAPLESGTLECLVAIYESGAATEIPHGENAGRELRNDFIVRRLVTAAELGGGDRTIDGAVDIDLDPAWNRDGVGVVAFVQDEATREIVAATVWRRPRAGSAPSTP
jgi:hypothetical protein